MRAAPWLAAPLPPPAAAALAPRPLPSPRPRRSTMTTANVAAAPAAAAAAAAGGTATANPAAAAARIPRPPPSPGAPLLAVAPMMDWTDVHYRQLARLLSRHTWLYTEMVVDQTVLHAADRDRFLAFPASQKPIVAQLGGSDPATLAAAAAIVAAYGYDEINLNCGCPSSRVAGAGCFGAALMLDAPRVAAATRAMAAAAPGVPVTVKCRLGVDDVDSYGALHAFVDAVAREGGVKHFVVHARKCVLGGLSPAQNRSTPPLRHGWVYALARDFPGVRFSLNGGVNDVATVAAALAARPPLAAASSSPPPPLLGVMAGRAAYRDPWRLLSGADAALWGAATNPCASRREALARYAAYAAAAAATPQLNGYVPSARTLMAPLLGMTHGVAGGRKWRAAVDAALRAPGATVASVLAAAEPALGEGVLDEPPPTGPPAEWEGAVGGWEVGEVPPERGA